MVLTTSQRQALKLLANAADGCTVPRMLGYGCSIAALRQLARCRLVITDRVRVPGNRRLTVVRLRISDAGRKALARQDDRPDHGRIPAKLVLLVLFVVGLLAGVGAGALMIAPA
jgi:hypothetical protein